MTRKVPTRNESTDLLYPCTTCNAQAGVWCTSPSGRWSDELHACRFEARREAMYGRGVA